MNGNTILEMVSKNNGIVTAKEVREAGIAPASLRWLVQQNKLEKTARGVYILPEVWEDEFVNIQTRFKKGIFSKETALFLHDLTDRTPMAFSITFPSYYNVTVIKDSEILSSKSKFYDLGIEKVKTPSGNIVLAYNMEKTLCDILRPRSEVDIQVIPEAFRQYVRRSDKNIPRLSEYAKKMKVEEKVRTYLEILL